MHDITERWLPVIGWEGLYEVSDLGRVRSLPRMKRNCRRMGGRILRPGRHPHGYPTVNLWSDNRYTTSTVHRLVARAFLGPVPPGMEIRHLDGDPSHCALVNLAYGTHAENMQDALAHGTNDRASRTHCPAGHEYTAENTAIGQRASGSTFRICRQCSGEAKRSYRERQREARGG